MMIKCKHTPYKPMKNHRVSNLQIVKKYKLFYIQTILYINYILLIYDHILYKRSIENYM